MTASEARTDPLRAALADMPRLERLVLAELASGRTNAQIARRLGYSSSYIKDVVAAARGRLNARDRAHAAALAVAAGLVVVGEDGFVPALDGADP